MNTDEHKSQARKVRTFFGCSRNVWRRVLDIPLRTLEDWELTSNGPSAGAKALLKILWDNPDMTKKMVADTRAKMLEAGIGATGRHNGSRKP